MKTKAFFEKYKGYPVFSVWEVDESGDKVGAYPLASLGTKKAVALANHLEDFKLFADQANQIETEKNTVKKV
jgi:hypothetical protein